MDEVFFRKITTTVILAILIGLSLFLLKPILLSIIMGFILAFIFSPVYNKLYKLTKSKNFPAAIICILVLLLLILPLWFFMPTLIDESIKLYRASQQLDVVTPLKNIFPSLFASQEFSQEIGSIIQSFITNMTNSLMNYLSSVILNFPTIMLQIVVVFFAFFYTLRDKDQITDYIKSLLPFSKEIEKKIFESTRDITSSVLYGYVIIGLIQGLILGIGFFIFNVPNAFILLILGIVAGILPLIGPTIVGIPVALYLFLANSPFSAIGILIFTAISSFSDPTLRPLLVSRKTELHTAIVFIGMIGGFFLFGVLGFILGPLILAYLVIIIEVYRNKDLPRILIQKEDKK